MSSQCLFEHVEKKWQEVWTIKHQGLVWQRHSLIFYIKNACNRCQLPIKESSHEHQRSCLSPALFNSSLYTLEISHELLISTSDVTPSGRDKGIIKNLRNKIGIVIPWRVCSNAKPDFQQEFRPNQEPGDWVPCTYFSLFLKSISRYWLLLRWISRLIDTSGKYWSRNGQSIVKGW